MNRGFGTESKVMFVIDAFAAGGAQQNLQNLLPEFIDNGYSVDLVLIQEANSELDLSFLASLGVRIIKLNARNMRNIKKLMLLRNIIKDSDPDAIFANLYWSQIWTGICLYFNVKIKLIWVEHNTYYNRNFMKWFVFKFLQKNKIRIFAVSQEILLFLQKKKISNIKVIPNCARKYGDRSTANLEHPEILFVGRLVAQKNPFLAIEAFYEALTNNLIPRHARLTFLGSGPLETQCKDLAEKLGLESKIDFKGFVKPAIVAESMRRAHILLMTSSFEGSPLVRLEALINGMTIVTTRTAGLNGILLDQNSNPKLQGIFVVDNFSNSIAENLNKAFKSQLWTEIEIDRRIKLGEFFSPSHAYMNYVVSANLQPH